MVLRMVFKGSYNFDTNWIHIIHLYMYIYIIVVIVSIGLFSQGKKNETNSKASEDGWLSSSETKCHWDSPLVPQSDSGRHARPGSRRRWLALKLPGGLNTKAGSFGLGDDREDLRHQAKTHHFEDDTIYKLGNPKFPDPHPYTYIYIYIYT